MSIYHIWKTPISSHLKEGHDDYQFMYIFFDEWVSDDAYLVGYRSWGNPWHYCTPALIEFPFGHDTEGNKRLEELLETLDPKDLHLTGAHLEALIDELIEDIFASID